MVRNQKGNEWISQTKPKKTKQHETYEHKERYHLWLTQVQNF